MRRLCEWRYGCVLLLAVLWLAMLIAVNPIGNFPLNDDWAWGLSVRTLLEQHRLKILAWPSMSLIAQIGWGALVCLPFGFSFTVLRLATALLGLGAVLASYGLLRHAGGSKEQSFFCALVVATNPLLFECANSFMTDTPFVAWLLLALLCFVRALRPGTWVAPVLAIALTIVATLTRQLGLLIPIALFVGCAFARALNRRTIILVVLTGVLAIASLRGYEHWLRGSGQMARTYGIQANELFARLAHPFSQPKAYYARVLQALRELLIYVGFFTLPGLLLLVAGRLKARRLFLALATLAALLFVWTTAGKAQMLVAGGHNLENFDLGPTTLTDTLTYRLPQLPRVSAGFWRVVTAFGLVGGAALIFLLVVDGLELLTRRPSDQEKAAQATAAITVALLSGYALVLIIVFYYDRYLIPLFPLVLIGFSWRTTPIAVPWAQRLVWSVAVAGWALQAGFTIAATHDYLAWNRARWAALRQLTEVDHASNAQIDGGFEYNGFNRYGTRMRRDKAWWWVEDDEYMVTLGPFRGYHTYRAHPYPRWIGGGPGYLFILQRDRR